MLIGESSRTVARAVGERLEAIKKSLPAGISLTPLLGRSKLVNTTVSTVEHNLTEGASDGFVIQANVRGRNVGSFVAEAMPKVEAVAIPASSYLEWDGQLQS